MEKIREGIIEIGNMKSDCCPELKFYVDFEGFNEGSGTPCESEEDVKKQVEYLINRWGKEYKLKIIDERIKQKTLF
jgi:hypothetical protein